MNVRIKLAKPLSSIDDILKKAGANRISGNGKICIFQAEPKNRLSIIRSIESAGGIIEEFHTDPPNWDTFIHHRFNDINE
jgi:hypothetical protein